MLFPDTALPLSHLHELVLLWHVTRMDDNFLCALSQAGCGANLRTLAFCCGCIRALSLCVCVILGIQKTVCSPSPLQIWMTGSQMRD